jgi:hypothetical protein
LGILRIILAFGASGFECLTVFASAMTVMVVAGSRVHSQSSLPLQHAAWEVSSRHGARAAVSRVVEPGQRRLRVVQADRARPVSVPSRWATRLGLSWAAEPELPRPARLAPGLVQAGQQLAIQRVLSGLAPASTA